MRVFLSLLLLSAACGDDGHDHHHDGGADHERCFGDEDTLAPGLSRLGDEGTFEVHILASDPDPLQVGDNDFTIRVTDPDGARVEGVSFDTLETWQRVHDHGTPVEPIATPLEAPGEFLVEGMNVIHRGSWLFRFGPRTADGADFVEFNFGVDCPPAE